MDDFLHSGLLAGADGDDEEAADDEDRGEDDKDDPLLLETGDGTASEDGVDEEDQLLADAAEHEAEMRALQHSDPAFFRHLQEHDADLLAFNKDDVMEERPEDDSGRKAAPSKPRRRGQEPSGQCRTAHCLRVAAPSVAR